MILFNSPDSSLNADFHFVPSVHVNQAAGEAINAYAATAGATATINQSTVIYDAPAPFTAVFSSRGPLIAAAGDLLKPDISAPGQGRPRCCRPAGATPDGTLTSTAAPPCRPRTWPAWRRCSSRPSPRGRPWRSSRRS